METDRKAACLFSLNAKAPAEATVLQKLLHAPAIPPRK
jgi:hypothetical protein